VRNREFNQEVGEKAIAKTVGSRQHAVDSINTEQLTATDCKMAAL